jgi:sec-independent protein translocase protein TatA
MLNLGFPEMLVVMGIAVLLFGKRLPEVGRSLGKGIIEFKKGLRGIEEEFDLTSMGSSSSSSSSSYRHSEGRNYHAGSSSEPVETSVPKFEPPVSAPVPQMEYQPVTPQD